jgi:hypothetical protein
VSKRATDGQDDDKAIDGLLKAIERARCEASDADIDDDMPNPDKFSGPIGMDDEGNLFPPNTPDAEHAQDDADEPSSSARPGKDERWCDD